MGEVLELFHQRPWGGHFLITFIGVCIIGKFIDESETKLFDENTKKHYDHECLLEECRKAIKLPTEEEIVAELMAQLEEDDELKIKTPHIPNPFYLSLRFFGRWFFSFDFLVRPCYDATSAGVRPPMNRSPMNRS